MKKLNKNLCIIALSYLASTSIAFASSNMSQQDLSVVLSQAVASVNAQTPMSLDDDTRLDSAATARNLLIYNNTMINYEADELDAKIFSENVQTLVIEPLCTNPDLAIFKELKVTMVYRYLGKNGAFIAELSKDMGTCP
jgi:hypothetical protein